MLSYIARRIVIMIPTLFLISIVCFFVIELPPGDIVSNRVQELLLRGGGDSAAQLENLRERYGLNDPQIVRYFRWIGRFLIGNMGYSLHFNTQVADLILERFAMTTLVAGLSLVFTWVVAFPIAIYSATNQYSIGDFFWTTVGFIGLAIPNFMFALILMVVFFRFFPDLGIGGLYAPRFVGQPFSVAKLLSLMAHLVIPVVVVGTAATCGLIRTVRANLLDELSKAYVITARAKGVAEGRLLIKYPARIALNPFFSTVGWVLPSLISGAVITAVVLGLPTSGPVFLQALRAQDMQVAGAFVMLTATLTVIGTLLSDILLVIVDPRIRYE